jgi:hypothetical protein
VPVTDGMLHSAAPSAYRQRFHFGHFGFVHALATTWLVDAVMKGDSLRVEFLFFNLNHRCGLIPQHPGWHTRCR